MDENCSVPNHKRSASHPGIPANPHEEENSQGDTYSLGTWLHKLLFRVVTSHGPNSHTEDWHLLFQLRHLVHMSVDYP